MYELENIISRVYNYRVTYHMVLPFGSEKGMWCKSTTAPATVIGMKTVKGH